MIKNILAVAVIVGGTAACTDSTGPSEPASTITLNLCSTFATGWFAYQNEGDGWKALTPSARRQVTFNATRKVSVAMSRTINGSSFTRVLNVTAVELQTAMAPSCVSDNGAKFMTGSVAGITGTQQVRLSAGPATDVASPVDPTWRLEGLISAPVDIIATRYASSISQPANRVLVRRGVFPPDGAVAGLDFGNTTESAVPQTDTVTFTGVGSNATMFVSTSVRTASGTRISLGEVSALAGTTAFSYPSLPSPLRLSTDMHFMNALAITSEGIRYISHFYKTPAAISLAFGPMVGEPTLALVSSAPYVRPRAQFASQAEYPSAAQIDFSESVTATTSRIVSVITSSGFLGGTPQTWEIVFPDLMAAGFPVSAGLQSNTYFFGLSVHGGDVTPLIGGTGADGSTTVTATRSGQATADTTAANRSP